MYKYSISTIFCQDCFIVYYFSKTVISAGILSKATLLPSLGFIFLPFNSTLATFEEGISNIKPDIHDMDC